MNPHVKLFTPGPGDVDEEILEALGSPVMRHYGPEWMPIHNNTLNLLHQIFKTSNDIYIVPGPASALLDMAIGSLLATGQKIIIGSNGFFGDRLSAMAEAHGLQIVPFDAAWGEPLDPAVLRDLLKDNPDAVAVAFVHHETSTTILNPLRDLAAVIRAAGKISIVDAVSSLGGVDVQVDDWGVDLCISGANKCIEAVPGIGFISISPRAWQVIDSHPGIGSGWYLNLRVWRKYVQEWASWHPTPVTLPTSVILAARAGLQKIVDRGLEAHFARYVHASKVVRTGLSNLGFEMFVSEEFASPIATGVKARAEFEVAELSRWLMEERYMAIGGGLGDLSGKMFRIGHLGKAAEREYLLDFLFAMEEFLRERKIPVQAGSGVAGLLV